MQQYILLSLQFLWGLYIWLYLCRYNQMEKFSSLDYNFTSNHSILLSDPGNESQGSDGSNAPLKSKIGGLVAEILQKTFRSMLLKLGSSWRFCSFSIGPLITPPGPVALSGHFSGSGQKYAGVTLKWSDHLSVTLLYACLSNFRSLRNCLPLMILP